MEAISGVFKTRSRGENAVNEALKAGIPADKITLLTPGSVDQIEQGNAVRPDRYDRTTRHGNCDRGARWVEALALPEARC